MCPYFKGLYYRKIMDREEEDEYGVQEMLVLEDVAIGLDEHQDEVWQDFVVDNMYEADSSIESDAVDNSIGDDEVISNCNEFSELMNLPSSSSSDGFDLPSEIESGHEVRNFKTMYKLFVKRQQELKMPAYAFRPLRLLKCLYKSRHDQKSYPIARSGHQITASESHLYSLGGYNPNNRTSAVHQESNLLFRELWSFNFASNRWKLIQNATNSDMPRELASNALVIHNNVLIVSIYVEINIG